MFEDIFFTAILIVATSYYLYNLYQWSIRCESCGSRKKYYLEERIDGVNYSTLYCKNCHTNLDDD